MRVAIASTGAGHVFRGIESWVTELAKGLYEMGIDITLFKGGGRANASYERVIPCIQRDSTLLGGLKGRIGWKKRYLVEQLTFFPTFTLAVQNGYDLVHLGDIQLALLASRLSRYGVFKPKVIFNNGAGIDVKLCSRFPYVQSVAPHYKEEAERMGLSIDNWFVIPHFVDTKRFQYDKEARHLIRRRLGIPDDAFLVLSVGVIDKEIKRMHWVIEETAKAMNVDKGIWLLLGGHKSKETNEVLSLAKARLGRNFLIRLDVSNNLMPGFYSAADVFVLATLREPFGIVFLEAMSSQLPAIGHSSPVTSWVIGDGGETVDMKRRGALAEIIIKYVDDGVRHDAGIRARRRVADVFSKDRVLKQILAMYNCVM